MEVSSFLHARYHSSPISTLPSNFYTSDGSRRRKVLYAIMIIIPMLFTILVLLLASYATIIYGLCVTVLGILLINAKRIGAACGQCGCCGTSSTEIV